MAGKLGPTAEQIARAREVVASTFGADAVLRRPTAGADQGSREHWRRTFAGAALAGFSANPNPGKLSPEDLVSVSEALCDALGMKETTS